MTLTVLVTGGAGYIGSHVARLLDQRGHSVIVLDRALPSEGAIATATYEVTDIRDTMSLHETFRKHRIDAVLHFAGEKSVEESMRDPQPHFSTNVCGSVSLFEAVRRAGVRHIIFSSSCAVYGTPAEIPVTEASPLRPENPYGETKAIVERMLHWLDVTVGLRYVSLRYFNAAGASVEGHLGEDPRRAESLLPRAVMSALGQRGPLEIFGTDYPTADGTAVRDYVHVADLAEAHLAALEHLLAGGASLTLNLGTGHGSSVRDVIRAVETVAGSTLATIDRPRRPGDVPALWADASAAEAKLRWRARRSLHEMIASTWRWYERHGSANAV